MIPISWMAAGVAGAVVISLLGVQRIQLLRAEKAVAEERAGRAEDRRLAADAAASAVAGYRAEEQRRVAALQETIRATQPALDAARAAAARVPDLDRRVRDATRAAAACGRGAAANSAAAAGSAPDAEAGDLPTIVLGRTQEAARVIARYADEAAIAGERCERAYDSLSGGRAAD